MKDRPVPPVGNKPWLPLFDSFPGRAAPGGSAKPQNSAMLPLRQDISVPPSSSHPPQWLPLRPGLIALRSTRVRWDLLWPGAPRAHHQDTSTSAAYSPLLLSERRSRGRIEPRRRSTRLIEGGYTPLKWKY